jgi:hypothetical protein
MTPERLQFLLDHCLRLRRARGDVVGGVEGHYAHMARFLGVEPITLRRWRTGARPIPRPIEIIMEILHAYPQITTDAVNNLISARDEETSKT